MFNVQCPLVVLVVIITNSIIMRCQSMEPIYGVNDLFISELPRRLPESTSVQSRMTSRIDQVNHWLKERVHDIADSDFVQDCRRKLLCQMAKYIRRIIASASKSLKIRCDSLNISRMDCERVWHDSLYNSVGAHFCRQQFPCNDQLIDLNFVRLDRLQPWNTIENSSITGKSELKNRTTAWNWIVMKVEQIAFHATSLSENCRAQTIGLIGRKVFNTEIFGLNCTPSDGFQCPIMPRGTTPTIIERLGVNKFSDAWHQAINIQDITNLEVELDYRYPCDHSLEGKLVDDEVNRISDFLNLLETK